MKNRLLFSCLLILLAACTRSFDGGYNAPFLYKIDIQQGNVIEQEMLNKLRPGMDKNQVRFIMGTPVIVDPFHNERWEYVYSFQKGGGVREQRHITLHFKDERLVYATGDIEESTRAALEEKIIVEDKAIVVPKTEKKEKGFFRRIWDSVTPGDN